MHGQTEHRKMSERKADLGNLWYLCVYFYSTLIYKTTGWGHRQDKQTDRQTDNSNNDDISCWEMKSNKSSYGGILVCLWVSPDYHPKATYPHLLMATMVQNPWQNWIRIALGIIRYINIWEFIWGKNYEPCLYGILYREGGGGGGVWGKWSKHNLYSI